jgi:uncharacterized membrane protein YhaH (DUF805 family)
MSAGAAIVWAAVAAWIAVIGLVQLFAERADGVSTSSAAWIVITSCSIVGPIAAVVAARLIVRRRDRLAGVALVISVITPTYFAAALNLPALIFGIALLVLPPSNGTEGDARQGHRGS